jgi:hypothetical protein
MIFIRQEFSAVKPIFTLDQIYYMYVTRNLLNEKTPFEFGRFVDYMKTFYTIY